MNIVITGSEGMVGGRLQKALEARGFELVCTDFDLAEPEYPDLKLDKEYIVIHVAGEKSNNPAALSRNNVLATNCVIDNLCRQELCKGLIYFSSIAVFGIQDEVITEDSEKKPDNFYGFSKLICENLIQAKLPGKTTVIIRPTNIIAPNTSTLVGQIVYSILKGETFEAWESSLITKRDYIWIDDVVDGVVKLTEMIDSNDLRGNTEINFCMDKSFSLKEIIDEAEKLTGKKLKLIITDSKAFRGRDLNVESTTIERIIRRKPKTLEQSVGIIVRGSQFE
ncbi:NAD-dependent epimerase/dehydratase family protein [Mesotoga sp. UBA5557]|uniref:NAD-dependent epimerase/dehydratase family protein n=1 Tax=Mesotoga sp. UBA5557 TaxID=1946857 RepID=UPI0025D261A8|nr:NAD(P)-dependent oxidoreductase [Mesotoga sp. UBA5557]